MFDLHKVPLPAYSRKEDMVNSVSHAIGVPLCILGTVMLLKLQMGKVAPIQIAATLLYTLSTMLVFLGSAIYHGIRPGFAKRVLRVLDHSNIYLMISGSVTAFFIAHILDSRPAFAKGIIAAVWIASAVGILFTFMDLKRFNIPQVFMYLALGWTSILGMRTIWHMGQAGKEYVLTVLLGSVFVSVGTGIYLIGKKVRYFHAVFHVFVLIGTVVMFIATYRYFGVKLA